MRLELELPRDQKIYVNTHVVNDKNYFMIKFLDYFENEDNAFTQDTFIELTENPTITLERGKTYQFINDSEIYPLIIKRKVDFNDTNAIYSKGVDNSETKNDILTFIVPLDSPDTLYYASDLDRNLIGEIEVVDAPKTFNVFAIDQTYFNFTGGVGGYNPPIYLRRGETYYFNVNTEGDPFCINTLSSVDNDELYVNQNVIENNNIETGIIKIRPNSDTPNVLFYNSSIHPTMKGPIFIVDNDEIFEEKINTGIIKTNYIESINSNTNLHFIGNVKYENMLTRESQGYTLRQVQRQYDLDTTRSGITTTWADIIEWPIVSNCLKNSKIRMEMYALSRNDSTSWGGLYFGVWVRVRPYNTGAFTDYINLGNSGFSTVMNEGDEDIHSFKKSFWLDIQDLFPDTIEYDFDFNVKWRARTYDGTGYCSPSTNDVSVTIANLSSHSNHFNNEMIIFEYASIRDSA